MHAEAKAPVPRESAAWNELYARGLRGDARPPAEVQSVPVPEEWGRLPPMEWDANAFLVERLSRAERWLDLGCGTGSVLAAFLRRFPGATGAGVDASEVAVAAGVRALAADAELAGRMTLHAGDLRGAAAEHPGPFTVVYALFSLQFLRRDEFHGLVAGVREILPPGGSFAGTARSTSRSVPASYVPVPGEPNTYVSHEPHEEGMIYHHYSAEEIRDAARLLGGRVEYLGEKANFREYDPAPRRAWWDFVITRP